MRILYSAIDQVVPAPHGGSVHVTAVAEGLAALGHEIRVLVSPGENGPSPAAGGVEWLAVPPPLGRRQLRLWRAHAVSQIAREFAPEVVIERYYNFGGEGILAARKVGAATVLEVNAPVVERPGSLKAWIDRLLIVRPLGRWGAWQCGHADLIVTPSSRILPAAVPRARILETEWGADTEQFHPGAANVPAFTRRADDTVVIFVSAFRRWHGAVDLIAAIRKLHRRGRTDIKAVLIGDGPELTGAREAAKGLDGVVLPGPLPHSQIPAWLASADIGAAPFDLSAHPTLLHEFHWSPLKIFEYMASALPVVAPRIDRLAAIVRDGSEGLLYDRLDPDGLVLALERLTDPALRRRLGDAARSRAEAQFSWRSHCRKLDRAIREIRDAHPVRH